MQGENADQALAVIDSPRPEIQAAPMAPRLVAFIEDAKQAMQAVRTLHKDVLRPGIDFGVIPGTKKPCLLKPGAETLLMAFQLGVGEPVIEVLPIEAPIEGHREYRVSLPIIHRATGQVIGYGVGSCSTMEKKYRYRNAQRICPQCGKQAIIKGKKEYGGGWLCYKQKDGCGAKFNDNDPAIVDQDAGQIENPDPADQYNTCLKMGKKRGLIDGSLTSCAASGTFTQDIEEDEERYVDPPQPKRAPPANGNPDDLQPPKSASPIPLGEMLTVIIGNGSTAEGNNDPVYVWQAAWKDPQGKAHNFVLWCWDLPAAKAATLADDPATFQGYVAVTLSRRKHTKPGDYTAETMELGVGPVIDMDAARTE